LVICDPNLKSEIENIIADSAADVSVIDWHSGSEEGDSHVKSAWQEDYGWDIAFSVYSDYIIPQHGLNKIRVPLNIHPALPSYPGVGYDVLPLIDRAEKCGATIHWMDEKIDYGVVLETKPTDLPQNVTYSQVRNFNQVAVLFLFKKWFRFGVDRALLDRLRVPILQGRGWTGLYTSEPVRRAKLIAFKQKNPSVWHELQIPHDLLCLSIQEHVQRQGHQSE